MMKRKKPEEVENQSEEFVKVVVDLPEPDLGISGEGLWAVALGDDVYEIRSSPWHARNINWGDWVRAVSAKDDEWPTFVSVVKRSGHRTMQIYILQAGSGRKDEMLAEINRFGASYENADGKMYALDCPPETDIGPIREYLAKLEERGFLDYRLNES